MNTEPSQMWHLAEVLKDLSNQHRQEYEGFGLSPEEVSTRLAYFVAIGVAETLMFQGKPVAIIAAVEEGDLNTTWFAATKAYFGIGIRAIRHAKRHMAVLSERLGPLVISSRVRCSDRDRWMKFIGWEKFGDNDGLSVFVYR